MLGRAKPSVFRWKKELAGKETQVLALRN